MITHMAYENSLDRVNHGLEWTWNSYMGFSDSKRSLVVIDEALDIVRSSQVKLEDINFVLGVLPQELKDKHPYALMAFESVKDMLEKIHEISKTRDRPENDRIVYGGNRKNPGFQMDELRSDLGKYRWDKIVNENNDDSENTRIRERVDRIIHDLNESLCNWNYFSRKGNFNTLNTTSLIIPEGIDGAVVLDATCIEGRPLGWTRGVPPAPESGSGLHLVARAGFLCTDEVRGW